jgi:putative oxidoreductase
MEAVADVLVAGPTRGPRAIAALAARVVGGGVFVAFGVGKFTQHASEVASFEDYGLPAPDAFVYAIGVVEVVGGLLLVLGFLTRPAALVLAGDMVAAIIVSGIALGEVVSLTVAPAELAVCLYLLWSGPGMLALDRVFMPGPTSATRGRARGPHR